LFLGQYVFFGAGHFLVLQGAYIAEALNVPASIIGLLVLSLGTNIPELVIVIRSVLTKHSDIAFGDYIGSATMNALIFGGVAIANGSFFVEASEFIIIAILTVVGLVLLYIFSRSERTISRREGAILLGLYALFLCAQIITILRA
jgi:cation:H+ antiporter